MKSDKPRRNDPCICGSGKKFKYCCDGKIISEKLLKIYQNELTGEQVSLIIKPDLIDKALHEDVVLKNFCKDNALYFFSSALTGNDTRNFHEKLISETLSREDFIEAYMRNSSLEEMLRVLGGCCDELQIFRKRKQILTDAIEAHHQKKYTLSVPVFFAQLEGILREYGNLGKEENIRSTIPTDIWADKLLDFITIDSQHFRNYLSDLFKGQPKDERLNRNSILHGWDCQYNTEENSLILFLLIIEVRMFDFWKRTPDYKNRFEVKTEKNPGGFSLTIRNRKELSLLISTKKQ